MSETVILGTSSLEKSGDTIRVTTPHGDVLLIQRSDIEAEDAAEAAGNLKRYTLVKGAKVLIEVTGESLLGADVLRGTITKWLDDGGTISKSRDDG